MIQVEVWGDYALFSRPELKVERMSYDVMTPSAARGILEAVYWHPGMKWVIERIHVLAHTLPACGATRSSPPSRPKTSVPP